MREAAGWRASCPCAACWPHCSPCWPGGVITKLANPRSFLKPLHANTSFSFQTHDSQEAGIESSSSAFIFIFTESATTCACEPSPPALLSLAAPRLCEDASFHGRAVRNPQRRPPDPPNSATSTTAAIPTQVCRAREARGGLGSPAALPSTHPAQTRPRGRRGGADAAMLGASPPASSTRKGAGAGGRTQALGAGLLLPSLLPPLVHPFVQSCVDGIGFLVVLLVGPAREEAPCVAVELRTKHRAGSAPAPASRPRAPLSRTAARGAPTSRGGTTAVEGGGWRSCPLRSGCWSQRQ